MVASEERWKRLIFRWTAPKGFVAMALFFALALLVEYLIVYSFAFSGLTDNFLLRFFFINLSPLFHLLPLGVIIVLVSSWAYLTKYTAVVPHRMSPAKKKLEPRRRRLSRVRKVRFKALKNFFGVLGRICGRVGRAVKSFLSRIGAAFFRIQGVSYVQQQLFFARVAVKSTAMVLLVFLVSVSVLYVLIRSGETYDLAVGLYGANPAFHGFVIGTMEIGKGISQALSPVGWLASTIDNGLRAVAPSFRNALEGIGSSVTEPLSKLDLVWGYIICQNLAAWVSAVVALAYGAYASQRYRLRKPQ